MSPVLAFILGLAFGILIHADIDIRWSKSRPRCSYCDAEGRLTEVKGKGIHMWVCEKHKGLLNKQIVEIFKKGK